MFGNGHVQFQGECGGAILQSYPTRESNLSDLSDRTTKIKKVIKNLDYLKKEIE
ncbi:MAG: hypothetical protein IJI98_07960 [Methanosphaera sp.]|nr:hypothetical protein [Methanosphaera sp.]